ncbi:MAG: GerMN domain-containing protein [Caldisericaceae bacterium]|nr:GerMN domain-containing protein [Caldisericaceae bacterium]
MKNKKTVVRLIALILFVAIILTGSYLYLNLRLKTTGKKTIVKLYYYDPIGKELIPTEKEIKIPSSNTLAVIKIIDTLKTPVQNDLFSPLNSDTVVKSINIEDGVCTLNLNEAATKIASLSVRKEAIRVYGLVNTLTELPDITSVQILIDNEKKDYFNHYIQIDHPIAHYSGVLPQGKEVLLYFSNLNGGNLLLEKREIIPKTDPVALTKGILQELFYGSLKGLSSPFPEDIDILNDFYIQSGGIVTIDFSLDILNHPLGSHAEYLTVLSIVNTLTELPDITSVQILIDGKVVPTLFGSTNISHPIKRFFALTEEGEAIIPYYVYTEGEEQFFMPVVKTINSQNPIETLFILLKDSSEFDTYLPENSTLLSYRTENFTLIMEISIPEDVNFNIDKIKQQIMLSYTELPNVKKVKLIINKEEFLLTRQ